LVPLYQTIRGHLPEESHLHFRLRENLKFDTHEISLLLFFSEITVEIKDRIFFLNSEVILNRQDIEICLWIRNTCAVKGTEFTSHY
jgi:hypothetical protein